MNKGKKFAASAAALVGLGAGFVSNTALAFADDHKPEDKGNAVSQGDNEQEMKVQGVVPGFAGVYSFDAHSDGADKGKDAVSTIMKALGDGNKTVKASLDEDGHGINEDTVHLYYDWMNKEFQDRLTGVKNFQTKVEAMRPGKPVDNPFTGEQVKDKKAGLDSADKMLKAAKDEFAPIDEAYKEDSDNVPDGMKELYAKFVKEKADQTRKNIDAELKEDKGALQNLAFKALKDHVNLDEMTKMKEFDLGVSARDLLRAEQEAAKSEEHKAELPVTAPGMDDSQKGWIFVSHGDKPADAKDNKAKDDKSKDDAKPNEDKAKNDAPAAPGGKDTKELVVPK